MNPFIQSEKRALRQRSMHVKLVLLKVLKEKFQLDTYHMRPADRNRLVMFEVWAERHHVPLRYVLTEIITMSRAMGKRYNKKKKKLGLGLSLAALTSKKFEAMLVEQMQQEYPGEENIDEWRLMEQEKALGLTEARGKAVPLIDLRNTDTILYNYLERLKKRSRKLDRGESASWRTRRRWRGNPWV
jgi:hypothetical protein